MTRYYCNVGGRTIDEKITIHSKLCKRYSIDPLQTFVIRDNMCFQFVWYDDGPYKYEMMFCSSYRNDGVRIHICNNLGRM